MHELSKQQGIAIRSLLVAAIGSSIAIWDIAFWLGVHGTIFYSKIVTLWIASTVVLLAALILPKRDRFLNRWGIMTLASPSVWFLINALTPADNLHWVELLIWGLALISFVIAIPYIFYILFELVETDYWALSPQYRNRLIFIVVIIAALGFVVGLNHTAFISCEQFTIAGDFAPADCASWSIFGP